MDSGAAHSAIGVDVGGTKVAFGLVSSDSAVRAYREIGLASYAYDDAVAFIASEVNRLGSVSAESDTPVGVAVAGWLNVERTVVRHAANLGWNDRPLKADLQDRTGRHVILCNDGDAAAYAEWAQEEPAQQSGTVVTLTLGTDVGGGVVRHGTLVTGDSGIGAELGHVMVDPQGPVCVCGNKGCLAVYASGKAMLSAARAAATKPGRLRELSGAEPDSLTTRQFSEALHDQDPAALSILDAAAGAIAVASTQISRVLDHRTLVLGGGAAAIGQPLLTAVQEALRAQAPIGPIHTAPVVHLARSKSAAGVIGAALLAGNSTASADGQTSDLI